MCHVRRIILGLVGLSGLAGCIVDPEVLRITHGFQSEPSAVGGQIIMLPVAVHAPDGQAPAFSWSTRSGQLSNPKETATESMILWMAPPCPSTATSTAYAPPYAP